MKLRFNTLYTTLLPQPEIVKTAIVILMMLLSYPFFSQSASPEEVKKEANRLFEEEEYTKAYKLFSQLVSNYPKDPEYNYKLGVCMIYSEPDKKKCLPYLQFAAKNKNEATKDINFFLGKAYHINYLFDEAIKNYEEFKRNASAARQKRLQVDREIAACGFGKKLLRNLTDLEVRSKKQLNEADYFRSYDLKDMGGKLLIKPEEFKTAADKKKKDHSIVFLPKAGNRVYYSSYGDNADQGRDIYYSVKMGDGSYSKPEKVQGINTEFDEDYPFLHPNGQTLYFASKGHNSMGGYDIFKSTYIEATNSWSEPVNLEFPINSPDDDYLFVTDSLEKTAYFSTGRQSPPGKIDVLKINTERKPIDIVAIHGSVTKSTPEQSLKSKISVTEADTKKPIGIYYAEDNGDYSLEVPNGAKLLLTVETPGLKTQSQEVALPLATTSSPYQQSISYPDGILKITNDFDAAPTDENYLQYLKVIEKKAKLEVNEGQNTLAAATSTETAVAAGTEKKQGSSSPQLVDQQGGTPPAKPGLDNRQLANIAKQDAQESRQEATQLKQDSNDAFEVGNQQKSEAEKKLATAEEMIKNAETISNEEEKQTALDKGRQLKQEAENDQAVSAKILGFAKSLEADASAKQKEAELNEQYAAELEKAISSKTSSQESMARLAELQRQIDATASQKPESANMIGSVKTEIGEKEKQITGYEKLNAEVTVSLAEIKTAITADEEELAKTKKKKDKEAINTRLTDLRAEQKEKETQLANNDTELKKANEELSSLKNELELATKIKTETIAAVVTPSPAPSTSITPAVQSGKPQTVASAKKPEKTNKTPNTKAAPQDNKPDYGPVTAGSASEAITKLDNLNNRLGTTSDNELFDYNGYQSPQAQNLKVEADANINEAVVQLKKLKEAIALSKSEIQNPSSAAGSAPTSQQLNKDADELAVKAQGLRAEANGKADDERDKLLASAKELEAKADEKYIQAAEVTGNDNQAVYSTNNDNIKAMTAANRAPETDVAEAKRLNEEADVAFKQAVTIREEARSLSSAGAKLGNLSNAEEIEAGALAKQQQAVDLLKKSNPSFALKAANTSTTPGGAAKAGSADLNQKLQAVNEGMTALVNTKVSSYQKLYEANNSELEDVLSAIAKNQDLVNKTPSFKSELIAGTGKIDNARTLKQTAETNNNPNDKLNNLSAAIKKQVDALKQLNKLNIALATKAAASENALASQNKTTSALTETATSPAVAATPTTEVATTTTTTTSESPPQVITELQTAGEKPAAAPETVDLNALAAGDTTAGQLVNYFNNTSFKLKNAQAGAAADKSLAEIKASEAEINTLDERIKNYQAPATTSTAPAPIELLTQADALLVESEQLNGKAAETRKEANGKTGAEQDTLMARVKELEQQSQSKKLEAAGLYRQANASDYATNSNALNELFSKLKTDNPALNSELEPKQAELLTLYDQTKKLREEADALPNPAAKLGAISNVEEKEAELIQKQNQLINELKKQYPDYVVKPLNSTAAETPEELAQKKNVLREKQYAQLTNLTNAFSLEYETSKNRVPAKLTDSQKTTKQNADALNAESKRLLVSAAQEKNETEKIKLLALSAKAGNAAVEQLNKLVPEKPVAVKTPAATNDAAGRELEKIGNNLANSNAATTRKTGTKPAATAANRNTAANRTTRGVTKIEGLEVTQGNAYSDARPIPLDAKIADGLSFRVQIGAFKTRLPNDAFKGLSPLNGETAGNGYIRYTAGDFNKLENANAVKNDLRKLGYNDAFVVVYYNGKRISLNEALTIMGNEGKTVDPNAPQTAGITANDNIPKAAVAATPDANPAGQENVEVTKELEQINGLLYTVQIGVYTKQITKRQLLNLKPIFTERLNNGLFRYTAGIYNNADRLVSDKQKVVALGVKDAFVSAYLNGKRVAFGDGKKMQADDPSVKMETENPIVFPASGTEAPAPATPAPVVSTPAPATTTVQPFKNNVNSYPAPTAENGVKASEEGITFKVQIGAYSKQVPADVADKFLAITTWPVENKQVNGLFIYNIGNFSEARFAKALKEEALKLGITDAFVTVYKDGVKLSGAAATEALSR